MSYSELDTEIDELELDEMTREEIEVVVSGYSAEGLALRKQRKDIRYNLYRIKTESEGGPASGINPEFIKHFESDSLFGGWRLFSITWDVAINCPMQCLHRDHSKEEEWDELVKRKFPQIDEKGRVIYPDITVKRKVEAHQKSLN